VHLLSGPAGHPLHPILATLPIGAFVSSLIFDILTRTRAHGLPWLVDGAYWLIGIGLVGGLLAAAFGLLDFRAIPQRTKPHAIAIRHLVLNVVVLGLFVGAYAWRATDHLEHEKTPWSQLSLSAVAVAVLLVSVWHGNTLVYRFGRRVEDRRAADGIDG
jgi:uncharacterized membrane protein